MFDVLKPGVAWRARWLGSPLRVYRSRALEAYELLLLCFFVCRPETFRSRARTRAIPLIPLSRGSPRERSMSILRRSRGVPGRTIRRSATSPRFLATIPVRVDLAFSPDRKSAGSGDARRPDVRRQKSRIALILDGVLALTMSIDGIINLSSDIFSIL